MIMHFVGRKRELAWLEDEYASGKPSFVVIYGRRRIGKTSLATKFIGGKQGIYYLADESPPQEQLKQFSASVSAWFGSSVQFGSWYEAFEFITKNKKNGKVIIAIDEFPYLLSSDKAVVSSFQKIWDLLLSKKDVMLILLGSSVSVMENKVLSRKSPLYGRRTSQIELKFMGIGELMAFFNENTEQALLKYGLCDGIPAYAESIREAKFPKCLYEFLTPNKYLYNEALFLLKQEFRETSVYKEILYAIGNGRNRFGEIASFSGIAGQKLPPYLKNLLTARLIKKEFPITSKKEFKGAAYALADNYLRFWFKFVYPYREAIERGNSEEVFKAITKGYSEYAGRVFEKAINVSAEKFVSFAFTKIGSWWEGEKEIDLIAIDEIGKNIFFAEIKWKDDVDGEALENELHAKAKEVKWANSERKEHYAVFAKRFRKRPHTAASYDLKDIERILKRA